MVSENKGNLPTQRARGPERGMFGRRSSRYTSLISDNISRVSLEPDNSVFEGGSSSNILMQGMEEIPLFLLRKSTLVMIIEDLARSGKLINHMKIWKMGIVLTNGDIIEMGIVRIEGDITGMGNWMLMTIQC